MLSRLFSLTYGVVSYLLFFLVFNYAILFISNVFVPNTLDTLEPVGNLTLYLFINLGLIIAFGLQHSIMARPGFKRWLTRFIPEHLERSTFVLVSTIFFFPLVFFWQPLGGLVWSITDPFAMGIIYSICALGWGILFLSTFQLNHFDLFGLRQVWLHFRGREYAHIPFKTPWLYRYMRHPLYVGLLVGMWAAPTMTVTHFVLALLCTIYVRIGSRYEEKDLREHLPEYRQYEQDVSGFIPGIVTNKYLKAVPSYQINS